MQESSLISTVLYDLQVIERSSGQVVMNTAIAERSSGRDYTREIELSSGREVENTAIAEKSST